MNGEHLSWVGIENLDELIKFIFQDKMRKKIISDDMYIC